MREYEADSKITRNEGKKRKRKNKHNKQKQEFGLKNTNALIKRNLHIPIEILTHEKTIGMQAMMDSGADISAIQIKYLPHGYEIHTNKKKICASPSKYPITNYGVNNTQV